MPYKPFQSEPDQAPPRAPQANDIVQGVPRRILLPTLADGQPDLTSPIWNAFLILQLREVLGIINVTPEAMANLISTNLIRVVPNTDGFDITFDNTLNI